MNFNMIEMRGNVIDGGIWKFLPADFVILYFFQIDDNSFNGVTRIVSNIKYSHSYITDLKWVAWLLMVFSVFSRGYNF